jgi:hypothetical protein
MTVEHAKQHMDIENFSYQNVASISGILPASGSRRDGVEGVE